MPQRPPPAPRLHPAALPAADAPLYCEESGLELNQAA